jgi:serine/threonine-protein kinase
VARRLSHEIQIGQLLDRRFEITALVERSGMATIFKALDCQTQQIVAIKVPHLEFEGSPGNSSRFAREAAIIGKLDHPGILKIIPVAEKSRPYVVMKYLEGETLYDILGRTRPLPECEALQLASRLCDILEYMHRHNVVHCDLKPGNIIISDDGSPHLIDFGIAKGPSMEPFMFGGSSPKTGTHEYMAPEQIRGDRVDARTDVYSLGAVLYEIVTGARPFQGSTSDEIFNARLAGKPHPPRELNNNLSEQIEEIILHAMAPNPSDRYRSAAAMKQELDCPQAVQVTGMYRNPRKASAWPKRLRLAAFVLSVGAAPFILFYLFLLMFQRQLAR